MWLSYRDSFPQDVVLNHRFILIVIDYKTTSLDTFSTNKNLTSDSKSCVASSQQIRVNDSKILELVSKINNLPGFTDNTSCVDYENYFKIDKVEMLALKMIRLEQL